MTRRNTNRRPAGGFTIVELLVVVTIIIVLVSLGVAVTTNIQASTLVEETKQRIALLVGVHAEYKAQTGNYVNHTNPTDPSGVPLGNRFNITWDGRDGKPTTTAAGIEKFYWAVRQVPECVSMLDDLPAGAIGSTSEATSAGTGVLDAWGTAIQYAAGNPAQGAQVSRPSLPQYSKPFFLSFGPDTVSGKYNGIAPANTPGRISGRVQRRKRVHLPAPRFSAASLIVIMIGAIAMVHGQHGFFQSNNGFEYNLALIGLLAPIFLAGPGKFSIGRFLPLPKSAGSDRSVIGLE